ncbi:hypothetical protein HanRHA438_Chr04g0169501 [Helianthus annuus]|nr:hypothetical protein HanRHA438_Chr04g0169501 [Helianthus annuus]
MFTLLLRKIKMFINKIPCLANYKGCHMLSSQFFLVYLGKTHFLVDPFPFVIYTYV